MLRKTILVFFLFYTINAYSNTKVNKIKYPLFTFPAIVKVGTSFTIEVSLNSGEKLKNVILVEAFNKQNSIYLLPMSSPRGGERAGVRGKSNYKLQITNYKYPSCTI